MTNNLTQEELKNFLVYNKDTGIFSWKGNPSNRIAGACGGNGYRNILINGKSHKAHRLAWLYVTGCFPARLIDHINGVKDDNRWVNLREATAIQNQQNRGRQANNTSGFKGVTWNKMHKKWRSQIGVNGGKKYIGSYETPELAYEAYCQVAKELHGDFYKANNGETK